MTRKLKAIAMIVVLALAGYGAYTVYSHVQRTEPVVKTVVTDSNLPVLIDSIKALGQWSLVSADMAQEVDTVDDGFLGSGLGGDSVRMVFYGTLHYGIDMTRIDDGWVRVSGDTAYITLPQAELLDNRFLDERRTQVVGGDQDFANRKSVRSAMTRKAKTLMAEKGSNNIAVARKRAEEELLKVFRRNGYVVKFV